MSSANLNDNNRFGGRSRNMFFIRHTAATKNLRTIIGVDGSHICAFKDDEYKLSPEIKKRIESYFNPTKRSLETKPKTDLITDQKYKLKMNSQYSQDLVKSYIQYITPKLRKEKILPPIQHWTGLCVFNDNLDRWQLELNSLGKSIGIYTQEEIDKDKNKQTEYKDSLKVALAALKRPQTSSKEKLADGFTNLKLEMPKTIGRFNESVRTSTSYAKFRPLTSKTMPLHSNRHQKLDQDEKKFILCNDETDREVWLLKIISQILDTESMQDIKSWLVSADVHEKNAMTELIKKAVEGLNQSGRVEIDMLPNDKQTQVDLEELNSLANVNPSCSINLNETDTNKPPKTKTNNDQTLILEKGKTFVSTMALKTEKKKRMKEFQEFLLDSKSSLASSKSFANVNMFDDQSKLNEADNKLKRSEYIKKVLYANRLNSSCSIIRKNKRKLKAESENEKQLATEVKSTTNNVIQILTLD